MDRNELRAGIFSYLKSKYPTMQATMQVSYIFGFFENKHGRQFLDEHKEVILDLIQEMINNNVIRPFSDYSSGYPFIRLTSYGQECIEKENLLPYDPEEFIKEIKKQVSNIDDVVIQYLSESVATYHRNCLLSSTITLGTASEGCMLSLIEGFANAISDSEKQAKFRKKINGQFINTKYNEFRKWLDPTIPSLPLDLKKDINIYLSHVFDFIRINRNEAGHPTGNSLSKKEIYAYHQIFADYAKKIYFLIDYFSKNKI